MTWHGDQVRGDATTGLKKGRTAAVMSSGWKNVCTDSITIDMPKKRTAQGHGKPLEPCEPVVS